MVRFTCEAFDPEVTFGCGQCFRWKRLAENRWAGVAMGRALTLRRTGSLFELEGADDADFRSVFSEYFDLGRDYTALDALLRSDPVFARAAAYSPGLRLLRQDPWETLCTFIFSQNNNIPRIGGIVERFCGAFGRELPGGLHDFPAPRLVAGLDESALAPLRCGFRAGYLLDAARKVASGEIGLAAVGRMPLPDARAALRAIRGVGPKVAECTLLFGYGRAECFPVDVWIGRAMQTYFPGGLPARFLPVAGIAQQYLFRYIRDCAAQAKRGKNKKTA